MPEKFVTMVSPPGGKKREARVSERSFERVWSEKGWTLKDDDKPKPKSATTTSNTTNSNATEKEE